MKVLSYTAAALIALAVAAPAFAQSAPDSAQPPGARTDTLNRSASQNQAIEKGANGQLSPQQNAQMPAGCTPADQSCGDANGNPAVNSPTQKKEVPASPAATTNP